MNPCEITLSITALANALSTNLCNEEIEFFASALIELGDTLTTICTQRRLLGYAECQK